MRDQGGGRGGEGCSDGGVNSDLGGEGDRGWGGGLRDQGGGRGGAVMGEWTVTWGGGGGGGGSRDQDGGRGVQ